MRIFSVLWIQAPGTQISREGRPLFSTVILSRPSGHGHVVSRGGGRGWSLRPLLARPEGLLWPSTDLSSDHPLRPVRRHGRPARRSSPASLGIHSVLGKTPARHVPRAPSRLPPRLLPARPTGPPLGVRPIPPPPGDRPAFRPASPRPAPALPFLPAGGDQPPFHQAPARK
jgi:hypothetical protein